MLSYICYIIIFRLVNLGYFWCFTQKWSKCLIIYLGDRSKIQFMRELAKKFIFFIFFHVIEELVWFVSIHSP